MKNTQQNQKLWRKPKSKKVSERDKDLKEYGFCLLRSHFSFVQSQAGKELLSHFYPSHDVPLQRYFRTNSR